MSQDYWLTVRTGPKVARERFDTLDDALEELEVAGPGRFLPAKRGGVDVRGDGSVQAYVGGVRRRPLKAKGRTTPFEALRQALS